MSCQVYTLNKVVFRIGNSTLHFRSHLVFAGCLIAVAVLMLFYFTQTGRARSVRWGGGLYNTTYPLTQAVRVGQSTRFRIAVDEPVTEFYLI